ncbi:hypothetical protein [Mycobacterium sp. 4858]|uniref:hypothetical protein n=1 Tax=Mycobacterium sp. 4858 TaxID=2057185 RepID=UPI001E5AC256|nr:hypothetical protein [Mycobacterium sp. 4858]
MKRDVCKFLSGSCAALAYVHAAYAVATKRGIVDEPVFLGRSWGVGYMWTEAAVYSVASLALGYVGWISKPQEQPQKPATFAMDGQSKQPGDAGDQSQFVAR